MRMIAIPRAVHPRRFGRRRPFAVAMPAQQGFSDGTRLFLWTYAAGFLAITIFFA